MQKPASTPNLKSGTTNMADKSKKLFISSADVCHILSECQKAGVTLLNYNADGLRAEFGLQEPVAKEQLTGDVPDHDKINKNTLADEEQRVRSERLALLQIEDPEEFERQLMAEELIDEHASSDDEEA